MGRGPAQRLVACRYGAGRPRVAASGFQGLGSIKHTQDTRRVSHALHLHLWRQRMESKQRRGTQGVEQYDHGVPNTIE